MDLLGNHPVLHRFIIDSEVIYNAEILILTVNNGDSPRFPEMVNHQVVRDPHHPLDKFAFFFVGTGFQCVDYLDEGILKNIISMLFILHNHDDVRKNLVFVAVDQLFKA
jgi:hypothetical protein